MWLSQAELRRDTPQTRQLMAQLLIGADADNGHGLVWTLFPDQSNAERDFLYREASKGNFLVLSSREPQAEPAIWSVRSRPFAPLLEIGQSYGFSLRANPTVAISQPDKRRSHRADVMMAAKARAAKAGVPFTHQDRLAAARSWLIERQDQWGVRFEQGVGDKDPAAIQVMGMEQISLKPKSRAQITAVDYQGLLTVTDTECLKSALIKGVGRGKAYGMGLLLLRHICPQDW